MSDDPAKGTRSGNSAAATTHSGDPAARLAAAEARIAALTQDLAARDRQIQELLVQRNALQAELRTARQAPSFRTDGAKPRADGKSGVPVSTTRGLAYRDPSRLLVRNALLFIAIAGVMILITAGIVSLFSPPSSGITSVANADNPATAAAIARGDAPEIEAHLDLPFVVDDVELVLSNPRIGPINQISLLGNETISAEQFLKIDVLLSNRSPHVETILFQPWSNAQVKDDANRKLRPIQPGQVDMMQEVKGRITTHLLKPGETATDVMIFTWRDTDAATYTLAVDPDFRRLNQDERMIQLSLQSFRLAFDRTRIARP